MNFARAELYSAELALFLLPLVNAPRIRALASHGLSSLYSQMRRVSSSSSDNNDRDSRVRVGGGNLSAGEVLLHDSPCTACQSFPVTTPYSAQPCGHVYCYYCVRARCKLDAHFKCPACNQRVLGIMQVS